MAAVLLVAAGDAAEGGRTRLRIRTSQAFAPCLAPALAAFEAASGVETELVVAEPDPPGDADVVAGDDAEMTRLLEGGTADLATSVELGYLPWVDVVPEGTPDGALAAVATDGVAVLGGAAGREARKTLQGLPADRLRVTRDAGELRRASHALVPRSLAGTGVQRATTIPPLVVTAALIPASPHAAEARILLDFLRSERGRSLLSSCLDAAAAAADVAASAPNASAVMDWWLPECSIAHNRYNDPSQVLGPPDAANTGGKDQFRGIMSLGQGGYVTVDMGGTVIDGPGADVRVFQTIGSEPVTVYASTTPQGPFTLVGLRERCGVRSGGVFSFHCDFDLRPAGLGEARYLKIEDGEIYPCLAGGTRTEGADIDAIRILNGRQ